MVRGFVRPAAAAFAAVVCLSLAACESTAGGNGGVGGEGTGGGRPDAADSPKQSDAEGAVLAKGTLQILRIDRSKLATEGVVAYTVKNVAPGAPKDLLWSVTFLYDPPREGGEIVVDVTAETSEEFAEYLASGEEKTFTVKSGAFASRPKDDQGGRGVRGTRLSAWLDPPVLAVARDAAAGTGGTKFVGGALECTGLSSLWDDPTRLVVDLQNVSGAAVPARFEMIATMEETDSRSKPVPVPSIEPGKSAKVTVDLTGVALGNRSYKLKVVPRKVRI